MTLYQIIPFIYIFAALGVAIYAFGLMVRLVRAHERTAAALEELARKDR